jgi:hypothetical protein
MTTKAKRGQTTKRIYSILRKTPGLTMCSVGTSSRAEGT